MGGRADHFSSLLESSRQSDPLCPPSAPILASGGTWGGWGASARWGTSSVQPARRRQFEVVWQLGAQA